VSVEAEGPSLVFFFRRIKMYARRPTTIKRKTMTTTTMIITRGCPPDPLDAFELIEEVDVGADVELSVSVPTVMVSAYGISYGLTYRYSGIP
jgi:hypothetical protein